MDSLNSLLSSFDNSDKSLYYKLEYCIYLHTNDGNKELIRGVPAPESSSIVDTKYSNKIVNIIVGTNFKNRFKYKGLYVVHTDLYYPELVLDLNGYIKNVYDILVKYVFYINETLYIDEFLENKKSTLLKITIINKFNNSGLIKDDD